MLFYVNLRIVFIIIKIFGGMIKWVIISFKVIIMVIGVINFRGNVKSVYFVYLKCFL